MRCCWTEGDLAGLPDFARAAARAVAQERGAPGKYAITLARSSCESFLQFSTRRDLREKIFQAWIKRGENGGATDNRALIAEIVALRGERAKLLGFATYADYRLDDQMAKTPLAARKLLDEVWGRARAKAARERDALQDMISAEGGNFALEAWDWRYYAEKLRKAQYELDEAEIKPYFQLDKMIEAAFETARRLFGLTFTAVDVPLYHPDARACEVTDAAGRHVGLFIGDYFARASKHSRRLDDLAARSGKTRSATFVPIILNVCNFSKPAAGEPALLSFDDARTLFHEFGHALHGLLSDVTYPLLAGTAVPSDFVELPSQLYEHWLEVAGDFAGICAPCRDRRADAESAARSAARHAHLQPGLRDGGIHRLRAGRSRSSCACAIRPSSMSAQFERDDLAAHRTCRRKSSCATGCRISSICSPAAAMRPAITPTCGRRCSTPTPSRRSRKPATSSIPPPRSACATTSMAPAICAIRREAYIAFRGRLPAVDALLKKRGLADAVPA